MSMLSPSEFRASRPDAMRAAGARVMRSSISRIQQDLHAKRMRSQYNEAATAFLAHPNASNWERLHRAMLGHQQATYGGYD